MKSLTIFTVTYNRARTLPALYKSLCEQKCKNFIWLVVDDGSTDNTRELIESYSKQDNGFEIRYVYKENGGMHTAHNEAYKNIDTYFSMSIDSDDLLAEDAVSKIYDYWERYGSEDYAGIIALDCDKNGRLCGKKLPDQKSTTITHYYEHGGCGDKKLVYRAEIIKNTPEYPVFEGEKYFSLRYKYTIIDEKYEMLILNDYLCVVDYQDDGSSNNMLWQYKKNPKGFAYLRIFDMQHDKTIKRKFISNVHFVADSHLAGDKLYFGKSPKKLLTLCAWPFGIALYFYIIHKTKVTENRMA